MWILLWVILSSILIGATLWSQRILMGQKAAWEKFAKTKNLTFKRGTFMGPAEMDGMIGDYRLSFFTAERPGEDIRTRRYVTAMEVSLMERFFDGGAMGTKEMLPFMQGLDKLHPYKIENAPWEDGHFVFIQNDAVIKEYLTTERLEAFSNILKTRNADIIIIFTHNQLVVRLETSDPMQDAEKIDKITKRLMMLCDKLRLTPEEREKLPAA